MNESAVVDAARRVGAKVSEIADVQDADAGTVISLTDGTVFIDVPEDKPDVDGKSGLMYLAAPLNAKGEYVGSFPVFSQEGPELVDEELSDDEYPEGKPAAAVLVWVNGDEARARDALEREAAGDKRKGLTEELEAIVAQYDASTDEAK